MSFLAPAFLALGLIGLVVIALHVQRRRTLSVPSLEIWRRLQDVAAIAPQRLHLPKPSWLLFLQLAAIAAAALALAQPLIGSNRMPEHWILVLDRSASMQIADAEAGTSRFEAAKGRLRSLLAEADSDNLARVSLISVGPLANPVVARRPYDAAAFEAVLAAQPVTDAPPDWQGAAELVAALYQPRESTRLKLFTDAAAPATLTDALPDGVPLDVERFGGPVANAALDATVELLDREEGHWLVSGEVTMAGGPRETTLAIKFGAEDAIEPVDWATVQVSYRSAGRTDPDAPVSVDFKREIDLPGPGILTVELPEDAASYDNVARFVLSAEPRALEVLYLGPGDQPLVRALQSIPGVSVFTTETLPADVTRFGLVIVDDTEVPRQPESNTLWVARGRVAGEAEPMVDLSIDPVRWKADHALSEGINWANVGIAAGYQVPRWPDAAVLFKSSGAPLIQARTGEFGREVRLAFDPAESDWPANPSFPGFVWRLVKWTGAAAGAQVLPACTVGRPCAVDARLIGVTVEPVGDTSALSAEELARMASELTSSPTGRFIPEHTGLFRLVGDGITQLLAIDAPTGAESMLWSDAATEDGAAEHGEAAPPPWPLNIWIWLAALFFIILLVEGFLAGRGQERFLRRVALARSSPLAGHRRLLLGLRLATLASIVAALFDLPVPWRSNDENVVLAVAATDGNSPLLARSNEEAPAAAGDQRVEAVNLGTPPRLTPARDESAVPAAGSRAALLLAAGMLPEDRPGRIVIESSPLLLAADIAGVLPTLAERGIRVDYVLGKVPEGPDAAVQLAEAPAVVYAGDDFRLTGLVYSTEATNAEIEILKDGELVAAQRADLSPGNNRIESLVSDVAAGASVYEIVVSAEGDGSVQNDRSGVAVNAAPAGPVAIISQEQAQAAAFAAALADRGIDSVTLEPGRAPFSLNQWLEYRGIVLMNVPAIALDTNQQNLIERAVFEFGRGLLILGGENSFGPGGYLQTPLDRVSPLSSAVPKEAPAVVLAFVLDRSGSMQQPVGDLTRLDIAKQATLSALDLLNPESQASIIVFDELAQTVLPLQKVPDLAALERGLRRVTPGGGTSIYPGLLLAYEQLRHASAAAKHVVVMTDGLTQPGDFEGLVGRMREAGITVSTVAVGASARPHMVEDIATLGGGAFHTTNDVAALPSILSQEAMMLAGAPVEDGKTQPQWLDRTPEFLTGMPEVVPPIEAFVLTTAKPQATVAMATADRTGELQPLLAHWRYGSGRVLALATDATGEWTRGWQRLETYPLFWSEVLREFLATGATPGLRLTAFDQGDNVVINVEAVGEDGAPLDLPQLAATIRGPGEDPGAEGRRVELVEIDPGHYRGSFVATAEGDYAIAVETADAQASTIAHVNYPSVFGIGGGDDAAAVLAAATGGRRIGEADPLFLGGEPRWTAIGGAPLWLLVALGLLMAELFARYGSPVSLLRSVFAAVRSPLTSDIPAARPEGRIVYSSEMHGNEGEDKDAGYSRRA